MKLVNLTRLNPKVDTTEVDPFWRYYSATIRNHSVNTAVVRTVLITLEDHVRDKVHYDVKMMLKARMKEAFNEAS